MTPVAPMWRTGGAQPAQPLPAPRRPAPAPEPAPPTKRPRRRIWPWVLGGLLLGAAIYQWTHQVTTENAATLSPVRTFGLESGPFVQSLRLAGTVTARDSAAMRAPRLRVRSQLTLTDLAEAGTSVKAGDVVARFESQELQDRVDDMQSNYVQAQARVDRERAAILMEREALRQERDRARAEYDKARLELRKAEVLSEIQAEILRNQAAEAEAVWRQLQQEMALQEEVFERRMRIEELEVADARLRYERFRRDLEQMTLRAPVGGLVVLEPMYKGSGQFQQAAVGDQVYPGAVFLRVVDLSGLLIAASVNQVDAQAIRVGQPATIGFDAYPDLTVEGRVSSVGAIAGESQGFGMRGGSGVWVKTIPVEIAFQTTDERVIPDLSAAVDVELARRDGVLTVPLEAVREQAGQTAVAVRDGEGWDWRPVELGERNAVEAVVLSGVEAGNEIALENAERP